MKRKVSFRSLCLFSTVAAFCWHAFHQPSMTNASYQEGHGTKSQPPFTIPIPFQQEMEDMNAILSLRQQEIFYLKKDLVPGAFPPEKLFSVDTKRWHSIVLNDLFAFRHIFKNGGTTVEKQAHHHAVSRSKIGKRKLVAAVRDPLDHFLSGWQECGKRFKKEMDYDKTSDEEYDGRMSKWLNRTKSLARGERSCKKHLWCICALHSLPQANFMISKTTKTIDPKIVLVGDLNELPSLLAVAGFHYDNSKGIGREASSNKIKKKYFPRKTELISNDTMRSICDFLEVDYFLFDFELPEACRT